MFLNFWYVLDVNKKNYYEILYSIVKKDSACDSWCNVVQFVFAELAYLFIIWGPFEGDGITSHMERHFSILLLSILCCHIDLLCLFACLYFVVLIIGFVTGVFKGPS